MNGVESSESIIEWNRMESSNRVERMESNGVEWNEWNRIEWNRMESNRVES